MVSFGAYVNMASAKDEYKDLQSAKVRHVDRSRMVPVPKLSL